MSIWVWAAFGYLIWMLAGCFSALFSVYGRPNRFEIFCMWSLIPLFYLGRTFEAVWVWLFKRP